MRLLALSSLALLLASPLPALAARNVAHARPQGAGPDRPV